MYQKAPFLAGSGVRKNGTVASGSSYIKIHYFDHPKHFIHIINDVYDFSIKYSDILLRKKNIYFITSSEFNAYQM